MKTYRGWRDADGICHITVREPFRHNRALDPPRGLFCHSAPDFDWGIGGSGTARTALALLAWYVFAPQCLSTLVAARRETNSWRYPALMVGYQFALAYAAAGLIYHASRWWLAS